MDSPDQTVSHDIIMNNMVTRARKYYREKFTGKVLSKVEKKILNKLFSLVIVSLVFSHNAHELYYFDILKLTKENLAQLQVHCVL